MFFVEVSVQILHLWEKKELFSVLYLTFEFSSYKFFFNYMIWKYFLLVYDFLKSLTCLFQRKKIKSSCLFFVSFYEWYFWCQHVRTHYLTRDDKAFHIFVIFHFVIIAILKTGKCYCILVLMCISLTSWASTLDVLIGQ